VLDLEVRKPEGCGPHDAEALRAFYEQMVLIRLFEPEAERQYTRARIGGYCHLATGQEAATVGLLAGLAADDKFLTGYRSHGFALARGVPPRAVMAELFGRVDGCAHGRGGSMHLLDVDRGYLGAWGIVAGQLPIATGVALAAVRRGERRAVLCELGDGAVNMGAWHEALNLAALWRLPVVFAVINNGYGMGTSVPRASAEPELHRRASAFRMHGERVDGNDLAAVLEASDRLLTRARDEREPAVLELMTYRFRGHSVADAGLNYRTREEVEEERSRDALLRAEGWLRERGILDDAIVAAVQERCEAAVADAVAFAEASPHPSVDTLAEHVYGDPQSAEQLARMAPGAPFGETELFRFREAA
jgi:pyruvate dehydrogenase E1 component alpha subunit